MRNSPNLNSPEYKFDKKDIHLHLWEYFKIHADQRMAIFNFYIVISTLLTTGVIGSFHKDFNFPIIGAWLSLMIISISFLFWKLECRNRQLIHLSEEGIKNLENSCISFDEDNDSLKSFKIFNREAVGKENFNKDYQWEFLNKPYSYRKCFQYIFILFGLTGIVGLGFSMYAVFTV